MYSISLDVGRGIIEIRMRGILTDAQRDELAEELRQAIQVTPPSQPQEWLLRVTAKPVAQYTPELAARVCALIEPTSEVAQYYPPPASRVVNCGPVSNGVSTRLVNFVTA